MVFVNAIARLKGWIGPAPERLFSGFCNARQHPTIFAASVRVISPPPAERCPCNAASTWLSDIARTTTL